jgi:hypothetical protein
MNIHWETYQRMHEFPLLEAAFLWLEIEPTKEMLESLPFRAEAKKNYYIMNSISTAKNNCIHNRI